MAKERLSRQPAADLNVPLLGIDVRLTREELEGLATGIVEQTIRVTQGDLAGEIPFATRDDSATCLTTLQLA